MEITRENFVLFAAKCYRNPSAISTADFYDDLQVFTYIKKLLMRYLEDQDDLQDRLILNHIIILGNVFGVPNVTRMLFFKMEEKLHPALKTFLLYLNYIPLDEFQDIAIDIFIATKIKNI